MGSPNRKKEKKKPSVASASASASMSQQKKHLTQGQKPSNSHNKPFTSKSQEILSDKETIHALETKVKQLTDVVMEMMERSSDATPHQALSQPSEIPNNYRSAVEPISSTTLRQTTNTRKRTRWSPLDTYTSNDLPRFFQIFFEKELKRTISPFQAESAIEESQVKVKRITSLNRSSFIIEVEPSNDSAAILTAITKIYDIPCKITSVDT